MNKNLTGLLLLIGVPVVAAAVVPVGLPVAANADRLKALEVCCWWCWWWRLLPNQAWLVAVGAESGRWFANGLDGARLEVVVVVVAANLPVVPPLVLP